MHQPLYEDIFTGKVYLPWVRLHTTKDYLAMLSFADKIKGLKLVFSFSPVLLKQIADLVSGKTDSWFELFLKPVSKLSTVDREKILNIFFMTNWQTKINSNPRYFVLLKKRLMEKQFTDQELLDLEILFHLSWLNKSYSEKNKELEQLINKGENYSEKDKKIILKITRKILNEIFPLLKKLLYQENIELLATPFYHPLIPDFIDYKICNSEIDFCSESFAQLQIEESLRYLRKEFDIIPDGIFLPECATSEGTLKLLENLSFHYTVLDELTLFNTLGKRIKRTVQGFPECSLLYKPYILKTLPGLFLFFRDRTLSSLFESSYQTILPALAVDDFIKKLSFIYSQTQTEYMEPIVTVALNGENCWERYPDDGYEFLNILYRKLLDTDFINLTTFRDYVSKFSEKPAEIQKLKHGTWKKTGFAAFRRTALQKEAWHALKRAERVFIMRFSDIVNNRNFLLARESLLAAQGSDWFAWVGAKETHPEFESLFYIHLKNFYKFLGLDVPTSIKNKLKNKDYSFDIVTRHISPKIDGLIGDYFEWQLANTLSIESQYIKKIYYGCDRFNFYMRVDVENPVLLLKKFELNFLFSKDKKNLTIVQICKKRNKALMVVFAGGEVYYLNSIGIKKIIELALPFSVLGIDATRFYFRIELAQKGKVIEKIPESWLNVNVVIEREEHWFV